MEESTNFDAIIIGTGQGGVPLARALAESGWRTAIVEREAVGGSCLNWGCTPTKTMVASARVAYLARRATDFGVNIPSVDVDMMAVWKRQREISHSWSEATKKHLENTKNVELVWGSASFRDARTVQVGDRTLTSDTIVINTGVNALVPEIPGLDQTPFLTNKGMMELNELPAHLVIIGGGYIGLEFGQMFRRFGCKVTILEKSETFLSREDEDIAAAVKAILEQDGIRIITGANITHIGRSTEGVTLDVGVETISGSHLLVAIGVKPAVEGLGLQNAGIEQDARGYIRTDPGLATNVKGIFAIGDVKGGPAFTHISYDDFRVLKKVLVDREAATIQGRYVPYTVFIDPQLGRIGLNEKEAKAQGVRYKTASIPMSDVARASESGEDRGLMKALVDPENGRILGCSILGLDGGELMALIQIAMMGNVPYQSLRDGIFSHPTLAESLNNLFMSLET